MKVLKLQQIFQSSVYTQTTKDIINPLPYNKFLDWSTLKAFTDNKKKQKKLTEKLKFVFGQTENIFSFSHNVLTLSQTSPGFYVSSE